VTAKIPLQMPARSLALSRAFLAQKTAKTFYSISQAHTIEQSGDLKKQTKANHPPEAPQLLFKFLRPNNTSGFHFPMSTGRALYFLV